MGHREKEKKKEEEEGGGGEEETNETKGKTRTLKNQKNCANTHVETLLLHSMRNGVLHLMITVSVTVSTECIYYS